MRRLFDRERPAGDLLEATRQAFGRRIKEKGLAGERVVVRVGPLSPQEAIGRPPREDFPILSGKEVIVEARVGATRGQAFTSAPAEFSGSLGQVVGLDLKDMRHRSIYAATLNAFWRYCGQTDRTVHCRDDEPIRCARELAVVVREGLRDGKVGLIGLQPAFLESLVGVLGAARVRVSDLDPDNIGRRLCGVVVEDGRQSSAIGAWADMVLVTGSAVVNGSFGEIADVLFQENKPFFVYGITAAAVCSIFDLRRWCAFGH